MAKSIKSIRIDDDLFKIAQTYLNLENEIHNLNISFSDFVATAICDYLSRDAMHESISPFDDSIGYIDKHGRVNKITLSDKQKTLIQKMYDDILGYCYNK